MKQVLLQSNIVLCLFTSAAHLSQIVVDEVIIFSGEKSSEKTMSDAVTNIVKITNNTHFNCNVVLNIYRIQSPFHLSYIFNQERNFPDDTKPHFKSSSCSVYSAMKRYCFCLSYWCIKLVIMIPKLVSPKETQLVKETIFSNRVVSKMLNATHES